MIIASIVLASQTFLFPQNEYQLAQLQGSLYGMAFSVFALVGSIWVLNYWLPRAPLLRHVFLAPPEGEESELISRREMLVDFDNLVGQFGTTTTPRSRQAQNATIHSGRFSLQKTILSPLRKPSAWMRTARRRAAAATSAYE